MSTYAHSFLMALRYRHQGHPSIQRFNEFSIRRRAERLISGNYPH
jgi:hypothetical protein